MKYHPYYLITLKRLWSEARACTQRMVESHPLLLFVFVLWMRRAAKAGVALSHSSSLDGSPAVLAA